MGSSRFMDQLEDDIVNLVEELEAGEGLVSIDKPSAETSPTMADIENVIQDLLPHTSRRKGNLHEMRLCLRRLTRCLNAIQEALCRSNQLISTKIKDCMCVIFLRLRLPREDESAFELAISNLDLIVDIMFANSSYFDGGDHTQVLLGRIFESENHKNTANCEPWLKYVISLWEQNSLVQRGENGDSRDSPLIVNSRADDSSVTPSTHSPRTIIVQLHNAIEVAFDRILTSQKHSSSKITSVVCEGDVNWYHFTILLVQQVINVYSRMGIPGEMSFREWMCYHVTERIDFANFQSLTPQGQSIGNQIEKYIESIVDLTLEILDSVSSENMKNISNRGAGISVLPGVEVELNPSQIEAGQDNENACDGSESATNLALTMTHVAAKALGTSLNQEGLVDDPLKLSLRLWKGLATSFVASKQDDRNAFVFCECMIEVASVALRDEKAELGPTITMTFLRALDFPDLLLSSEHIWVALERHILQLDNIDMVRALQTAALKLQRDMCIAAHPPDAENSSNESMKEEPLQAGIIKRIIRILKKRPSTKPVDPWDEFFVKSMSQMGFRHFQE